MSENKGQINEKHITTQMQLKQKSTNRLVHKTLLVEKRIPIDSKQEFSVYTVGEHYFGWTKLVQP